MEAYADIIRKLPKKNLEDDYNILAKIGSGGFGVVYRVESKDTGKIYAGKRTDLQNATKDDYRIMLTEINLLS